MNSVTSRELEHKSKMDGKLVKVHKLEIDDCEKDQQKEKKLVKEGVLNGETKALKAEVASLKQDISKQTSVTANSGSEVVRKKETTQTM